MGPESVPLLLASGELPSLGLAELLLSSSRPPSLPVSVCGAGAQTPLFSFRRKGEK